MTKEKALEIISENLSIFPQNKAKIYHSELPEELEMWYCYPIDSGHSIMAMLECHYQDKAQEEPFEDYLMPLPVKQVLRNYKIVKGFVIVEGEYNENTGAKIYDGDDEY